MVKQKDFSQTQVRIPHDLLEELKISADRNFRSLNSEILYLLQIGLKKAEPHATPEQVREIITDVLRSELKNKAGG